MAGQPFYRAAYEKSHALIVGIDRYKNASPLAFAANDATSVAEVLRDQLGFPAGNVTLLTDEKATRAAISSAYLRFSDPEVVGLDDRLFVFFAGHGHTVPGRRGETGFLVPVDGSIDDLSTLIRWNELTGSADLIQAKHVFFLMDACYGGLALTRKVIPPGSMRLLNDMLQRFSRQVLTAGKADEPVSDGGGTRPGHSIFTSHVLDALEGAASATEGVITANGLMAYVYEKVGSDPLSHQTPHYGFLEGDGDFIFKPMIAPAADGETEVSVLIQTPSFSEPDAPSAVADTVADQLKRLIADPTGKIRLNDFVSAHVRHAIQATALDKFPVEAPYAPEAFAERIGEYEQVMSDLETTAILLGRWSLPDQLPFIDRMFARLAETDKGSAGNTTWIRLGWYPTMLLMYAGGIAALSEGRFDALRRFLLCPVRDNRRGDRAINPIVIATMYPMTDLHEVFKTLPGMDRRYTPRSDHLFQSLQPALEDQLFLGESYENLFDLFEIYLALAFVDSRGATGLTGAWGPPGRFLWKHAFDDQTPLARFTAEAAREGENWAPLRAGMFGGDPAKFQTLIEAYRARVSQVNWY